MKELLEFESMITPKIIKYFYWLLLVLVGLTGLGSLMGALYRLSPLALIGALVGMAIGAIGVRVWCEILIVIFRISDDLKKIAAREG